MTNKKQPKNQSRQRMNQDSREVILRVSQELFTKQGYEGTSINDICTEAGLNSKASIYNHFVSKENIAEELTDNILKEINQIILSAADKCSDSDPLTQFITVFRAYIEWALTHRPKFAFRIIRAQEIRMLHGMYDYQKTPSITQLYPRLLNIIGQLRTTHYPVRPIADEALFHMIIGAVSRAVIDSNSFKLASPTEIVEPILDVCLAIVFSKPIEDHTLLS